MASTHNPIHRLFAVDIPAHGDNTGTDLDLSKNLQVISLGISRTGTTSLQFALDILGYNPCHGGVDVFRSVERTDAFIDVYAKIVDVVWKAGDPAVNSTLRELMKGYLSITDSPAWPLPEEMYKAFPNARFNLNVRPGGKEEWWKSFLDALWDMKYGGSGPDVYDKHNEDVKRLIPADQLLVFDVTEGWEPLCKFLGKPIPNEPFPRKNDAQAMKAMYFGFMCYGAFVWAFYIGGAAAAGYLALKPEVVKSGLGKVMGLGSRLLAKTGSS